jgi:uncharacterized protein (DUF2235 family)
MSKNIVLCCDGTANEFAKHHTNVLKLYAVLRHDRATQVTYYHPGLGTMEPAGALTTLARKTTKLLGMALWYGLSDDVRDAYVFLMRCYEPEDKGFLFGFSRGAYTARAVASLLHMYGLIEPGNDALVPYAIRMMMGIERARGTKAGAREPGDGYFDLARAFKDTMSRTACKPWFVGVWDTVSSIGWVENPLKLPFIANNADIEIGRHAIAIDERRAFFRTHLWRPSSDPSQPGGPKDLKQVWFPGVHCDVGGGYPEAESGLSKIALEWMLGEAEAAGLLVDASRRREVLGQAGGDRYVAPNALAAAHESLAGAWRIAEYVPKRHFDFVTRKEGRRMNLGRRRTIPPKSLVHASAFERGEGYRQCLPADAIRVASQEPPLV